MEKIYFKTVSSPIGDLILGCVDAGLCLLQFCDAKKLATKRNKMSGELVSWQREDHQHLDKAEMQLQEYFAGERQEFALDLFFFGTDFQKSCWNALKEIPYGKTWSYSQEAQFLNMPKAFRAVANANGANNLSIIIPCHRVIAADGKLGGYSSGIERKKFLLELENCISECTDL